jgi:hypothetical protein
MLSVTTPTGSGKEDVGLRKFGLEYIIYGPLDGRFYGIV